MSIQSISPGSAPGAGRPKIAAKYVMIAASPKIVPRLPDRPEYTRQGGNRGLGDDLPASPARGW
jgi:hypothetical protein